MKKILALALACSANYSYAQSELDKYFTGSNTFLEIGTAANNLTSPHDLDYVPGRQTEWWVLNKEANGGSVVIFFEAGKPNQSHQFRRDSHNEHFMARAVAIAFGDENYFVSAQEIKSTASASSTFMGPCLWSSDTAIFARMHQNNWVTGQLLGSHIDMLHQSPYGMGIAHDNANVYWYFDGHNGNICKYDFGTPHGVGEDDHSDGKIHRYIDATVTRKPNVPSHMALDKANNWLYYVDGGTNRVMRLKTNSGTVGANLTVPSTAGEPLSEYKQVTGATVEVVVSTGLTSPCGIDYRSGRLIVSDNGTGNILIYNVTTVPAILVGTLITGGPGVMGVRVDNNNKIWYVNNTTKKFMKIENPNIVGIAENMVSNRDYSIYPNPATDVLNIRLNDNKVTDIRIYSMSGQQVFHNESSKGFLSVNTSQWAKGVYTVLLSNEAAKGMSKVVIQ